MKSKKQTSKRKTLNAAKPPRRLAAAACSARWRPVGSSREIITHDASKCAGRPCCVHRPSNHHMKDWPQIYREDIGVTERICPHGVGHPDPDQPWPADDWRWVHGCDGCCRPNNEKEQAPT